MRIVVQTVVADKQQLIIYSLLQVALFSLNESNAEHF